MSIRILKRDFPHRTIALVTETHALIFRHSPSSTDALTSGGTRFQSHQDVTPRCMVEFSPLSSLDLDGYRPLTNLKIHGTLGLTTINNDVFICVITSASQVATVRPDETVQRVLSVEFYCLNRSNFDYIQLNSFDDGYADDEIDPYAGTTIRDTELGHPCSSLKKILSSGTFYYSANFDLTNRLQNRSGDTSAFDIDNLDEGFLWNSYMIDPLVKFRSRLADHERQALDESRILTSTIRGYVFTLNIPPSLSPLQSHKIGLPSTLTLISRLSCLRAGTRFNARGIDDDGNVANFVESETVFYSPLGLCFSYAQVRGSVPLFWEQAVGLIPGQQKIQITRSPEATQPSFDKHFEGLEMKYGAVHILNLLSESRPGEAELTRRYESHLRQNPLSSTPEKGSAFEHRLLEGTAYDFNAETKGPGGYEAATAVKRLVASFADGFAYYMSQENPDLIKIADKRRLTNETVVLQQEGVFRTNCLDCLDRTNLVQSILSQMALEQFFGHQGVHASPDFWLRHSTLWADNGDALSKIYAGTGALKSSFTRHGKMSWAGALADARKSATRLYINNFADKERQNTVDLLLGRLVGQNPVDLYDPINDDVVAELNRRSSEYSASKSVNILVATMNVNGRSEGLTEDLSSWLCPELNQAQSQPDIVVVGFQEIVELSPQQIMSTDPARRMQWEVVVKKTLNQHSESLGGEEYVFLRSGQLVGAALLIFVKTSILPDLKNVEGAIKKTGLSGMAGNKGAVAIRMDLCNTRICFVTAHLAAGFANYDERNRDFQTISHGLRFQKNRSIEDHDAIIWLGDFNYRIGLSNESVRKAIAMGDLDFLYENDQLNLQMVAGLAFPFYNEARITFMPTYKYDIGTDIYDTSEKARIPAWCDRVLKKGSCLRQINYNTAAIKFSDHRPVYATFECTVSVVNEAIKDKLGHEIYMKRRAEVGNRTANADSGEETDDEDLIGYEAIAPGLPPASSDRRKWWLDNGLPARSTIKPPGTDMVPNPYRPSNPFVLTTDKSWVPKDQVKPPAPKPPPPRQTSTPSQQIRSTPVTSTPSSKAVHAVPPPWDPASTPTLPYQANTTVTPNRSTTPTSVPSQQTRTEVSTPSATPIPKTKPMAKPKPIPMPKPKSPALAMTERTEATSPTPSVASNALSTKKAAPPKPTKPAILKAPNSPYSSPCSSPTPPHLHRKPLTKPPPPSKPAMLNVPQSPSRPGEGKGIIPPLRRMSTTPVSPSGANQLILSTLSLQQSGPSKLQAKPKTRVAAPAPPPPRGSRKTQANLNLQTVKAEVEEPEEKEEEAPPLPPRRATTMR